MRKAQRNFVLLSSAVALALGPITLRAQDAPSAPTVQPSKDVPAGPALVTRPPGTEPATGPTTRISMNFQDAPIDTVLERLSQEAGFVILKPDSKPIPGRVTVRSTQPITPAEAVTLLNTILINNDLTVIQMGRILKITSTELARKGAIPVYIGADPEQIEPNDQLVTWVIPLRNVDAVKLKADLQPLIPVNADLTSNASSNSLIMTDTKANIRRIVQIVSSLDKRDSLENSIKVRQLKYADATAAAKLVTDIFKADSSGSGGGGAANNPLQGGPGAFFRAMQGGGGQGGGGRGGGGGGGADSSEKGQVGKVTASADTRTNTIVVTGPTDTLKVIDTMLDQLDANPAADQTFFIYPVRNGQAVDIQATLNSLFGNSSSSSGSSSNNSNSRSTSSNSGFGTGSSFGTSSGSGSRGGSGSSGGNSGFGSSGNSGFGSNGSSGTSRTGTFGGGGGGGAFSSQTSGPLTATSELKGQVYVVADTDTNSLLVATATKYEKQVRDILKELDRPVPQVLIKVLIAEVSHDNADDVGLDFSVLNLRASGNGTQGGTIFGNALAATAAKSTGAGGLIVSLMEDNVTATIRALATAGKVDVLSRPYILASDNQQASILVGQEVPIITSSQTTDTGNIINNISYESIGIILNVTPHINPDGLVIMDVAPEISAISDSTVPISSSVTAPVFDNRSAQSRVGIKDGDTIVIGGLMQDQKTQTINKVPILGDIPGLGLLFQRNQTKKTKTELLIFLTPHVAAQSGVLKPMSQDEMRGVKLVPNAVEPGAFQEHMRGMDRGGLTTQPTPVPQPTEPRPPETPTAPAPGSRLPEPPLPGNH